MTSGGTVKHLGGSLRRYGPMVLWAVLLAVLLAVTIAVTTRKNATHLDTALWEFILFGIGLLVSFYFGRKSVKEAASDVIRPAASAALRRLVSLGKGIRTIGVIAGEQAKDANETGNVPADRVVAGIETLSILLEAQVAVVIDAIEDWRQFTPDLVNQLQEEGKGSAP